MNMVEKVARAIAVSQGFDGDDWLSWEEYARAAIAAMREPDDAMRKAVNDLYRDHARGRLDKPDADEIWPVMIDAALNEGKE